jgi:LacI family transcriptional regulator
MSRVTIDDVAELAGVSIKTVSRVLNREPNVRESTRERVNSAIDKLRYSPNLSARNLASHHSHLIVLVYDDPSVYEAPSSGFIVRMQQGVLRACRRAHYELLIHPCNYRQSHVRSELQSLIRQMRPDGVVLGAPLSNMPKVISAVSATNTPFVRVAPGTEVRKGFAVATNDREVSAEMTRYLASLGHRRIAFIQGNPAHKAVARRYLGYRDGLKQCGLTFEESLVSTGNNSIAAGVACAEQLLSLAPRPTAIFAANDDMAAGVIRAASRLGIRVPDGLSVAGFDDNALARHIFPTLTTVRQPLDVMTDRAAMALIDGTRQNALPDSTEVIPAELRIRESTGPAP